jgi:hypothetical protein
MIFDYISSGCCELLKFLMIKKKNHSENSFIEIKDVFSPLS